VGPEREAALFDRPEVIETTRESGFGKRRFLRGPLDPGDFYRNELPCGHDLPFVSAIKQQNSSAQNQELFSKEPSSKLSSLGSNENLSERAILL
jgi:hypothetical protein